MSRPKKVTVNSVDDNVFACVISYVACGAHIDQKPTENLFLVIKNGRKRNSWFILGHVCLLAVNVRLCMREKEEMNAHNHENRFCSQAIDGH